jgi:hypothetical protein
LDSRLERQVFRLSEEPNDDTLPERPKENPLRVSAGEDRVLFVGEDNRLQATVEGQTGEKLSFVWSTISQPSGVRPPLYSSATNQATGIKFAEPGPYKILVTVQDGIFTACDTLFADVRFRPPPEPKFLYPEPGKTLLLGQETPIAWEWPFAGPGRLEISLDQGLTWMVIAADIPIRPGLNSFSWVPSLEWAEHATETGEPIQAIIRLQPPVGEPFVMAGSFFLKPPQ